MKTTLRKFQREFVYIRAQAGAGETVEIEADGAPRYVFKLLRPAERGSRAELMVYC